MGAPITFEQKKTAVLIMDYQIRIFNFFRRNPGRTHCESEQSAGRSPAERDAGYLY